MQTKDLQNTEFQERPPLMDEGVRLRAAEEFGLELDVAGGRLCLSQRRHQQWGVALVALIIGIALLVLPTYLPADGFPVQVVSASAYLFGACLVLLAAYLPFAAVDVEISRRRIERVRRWWGIAFRRRTIPSEAVADLSIDPGRHGTIGRSYDLVGRGEFGKLKLIDDIPDREFLDTIRRQVMLAAGLRPSGTH